RTVRTSDPIRLRIISEGDLLVEMGNEERQLAAKLDEAIARLRAAIRKYEFVISSNNFKDQTPENVDAVKVRGNDALQDVDKARDTVQTVVREMRRLARESEVNRMEEKTQKRYRDYCEVMDAVLADDPPPAGARLLVPITVTFPMSLKQLTNVQNVLNGGTWAPGALVGDANQGLYALDREVTAIRQLLGEDDSRAKLIANARKLIDAQRKIDQDIEVMYDDWRKRIKDPKPAIGDVGQVALAKGEAKKIQHKIEWRQYKEDDLDVTITSSDPSALVVPEKITVNFDKNPFRFEYEVKAGAKAGNYTITLTPAVGKPVVVAVVVQ
ncbi:MAG: hypothetical protein K2V38_06060, partial [Gemmataceae bacterium]|nr:hypothetical protein [Gemmataceae bacterium]